VPGRHEIPLVPDGTARTDLAIQLRQLREKSGLTYRMLATLTHYSVTQLRQACSGTVAPTWEVVAAFVTGCGGEPEEWRAAHKAAREGGSASPLRVTVDPAPVTPEKSSEGVPFAGGPATDHAEQAQLPESAAADLASRRPGTAGRRMPGKIAALVGVLVTLAVAWWFIVQANASSEQDAAPPQNPVVADSAVFRSSVAQISTPSGIDTDDMPTAKAVSSQMSTSPANGFVEVQFVRGGASTFTKVGGGGTKGPRIPFKAEVPVICKQYAPTMDSVVPDGYWYQLGGEYKGHWAAANIFLNGDSPSAEKYTHNTNWSIPDC